MKTLVPNLTVAISCLNNVPALNICIGSILVGSRLPAKLQVRLEGDCPGFNDYYLEQLFAYARFLGIEPSLTIGESHGIRATREWQIRNARTDWVLFLDDDVILDCNAIQAFVSAHYSLCKDTGTQNPCIYLQGNKCDVNNRRGYKDFSAKIHDRSELGHLAGNYNWWWAPTQFEFGEYFPVVLADMGCIMVDRIFFLKEELSFLSCKTHTHSGGEDTLFGLACAAKSLPRYWVPRATAIHLEKPVVRMSEHAYRKELILRTAELTGLPTEPIESLVLPWEKVEKFEDQKIG